MMIRPMTTSGTTMRSVTPRRARRARAIVSLTVTVWCGGGHWASLTLGSRNPYSRSTTRLTMTKTAAMTRTQACTTL